MIVGRSGLDSQVHIEEKRQPLFFNFNFLGYVRYFDSHAMKNIMQILYDILRKMYDNSYFNAIKFHFWFYLRTENVLHEFKGITWIIIHVTLSICFLKPQGFWLMNEMIKGIKRLFSWEQRRWTDGDPWCHMSSVSSFFRYEILGRGHLHIKMGNRWSLEYWGFNSPFRTLHLCIRLSK